MAPRKSQNRTKEIPIHDAENVTSSTEPSESFAEKSYELHIEAAHAPNEVLKKKAASASASTEPNPAGAREVPSSLRPKNLSTKPPFIHKVWNTLEWLATSALIFTAIFFVINFQAYSTLFVSKLNKLRGDVAETPYVQNLTNHPASLSQQPLPVSSPTTAQSKKQIPTLDLAITPPDDRIILPRIKKSVPVIKVSDENLIKRDWSGLEADIQNALRDGVVHYPGTSEVGSNGNVVITGHSSYFPWDPGRFKDVFALLHELKISDQVIVYHQQKKYVYEVYETKVVTPDKVDVLTSNGENRLTLITCTPIGTNLKRLIVLAKPVPQQ